ncbi:hypothetical protein ACLOJK_019188 [Asimina triloba]
MYAWSMVPSSSLQRAVQRIAESIGFVDVSEGAEDALRLDVIKQWNISYESDVGSVGAQPTTQRNCGRSTDCRARLGAETN